MRFYKWFCMHVLKKRNCQQTFVLNIVHRLSACWTCLFVRLHRLFTFTSPAVCLLSLRHRLSAFTSPFVYFHFTGVCLLSLRYRLSAFTSTFVCFHFTIYLLSLHRLSTSALPFACLLHFNIFLYFDFTVYLLHFPVRPWLLLHYSSTFESNTTVIRFLFIAKFKF